VDDHAPGRLEWYVAPVQIDVRAIGAIAEGAARRDLS